MWFAPLLPYALLPEFATSITTSFTPVGNYAGSPGVWGRAQKGSLLPSTMTPPPLVRPLTNSLSSIRMPARHQRPWRHRWSLLGRPDISVRTVGRVMALNKLLYGDIPHVPKRGVKRIPGPHPHKARYRRQYWFIDGRQLDVRVEGVKWGSMLILEGYSRTIFLSLDPARARALHCWPLCGKLKHGRPFD
jgi:hypothetical protein